MEEKVTEFNITVPWLERKIVKINKVGKTELTLEHFDERCFPSIDNFNCPWRLLSEEDKNVKRYVRGEFTDVCDRLEMNVTPGVEYISDERSNKTLHIEVIGIKVTPDTNNDIYRKYVNELGYKRFNITSLNERFPDGHGDFESIDYIYDEHVGQKTIKKPVVAAPAPAPKKEYLLDGADVEDIKEVLIDLNEDGEQEWYLFLPLMKGN